MRKIKDPMLSKLPAPTEASEGLMLVAYMRLRNLMFTHVGNETGGSFEARKRAIRMKQQGTSPGFCDYIILVNGCTIAIELKRLRGSHTSPEQRNWIDALNANGTPAYVCKGAQEAIDVIDSYITGKPLPVTTFKPARVRKPDTLVF